MQYGCSGNWLRSFPRVNADGTDYGIYTGKQDGRDADPALTCHHVGADDALHVGPSPI